MDWASNHVEEKPSDLPEAAVGRGRQHWVQTQVCLFILLLSLYSLLYHSAPKLMKVELHWSVSLCARYLLQIFITRLASFPSVLHKNISDAHVSVRLKILTPGIHVGQS